MGILAIGLTFVVVSGEIDLSFGANSSLAAVLSLILLIAKVNVVLIWIIILALAIAIGYINSVIVLHLKVPALLGTIGSWLAVGGIVAWMAKGTTVWTSKYPPIFDVLGRGRVFGPIPVPIITLFVVAILGIIFLEHTILGRYFYAVGGNANAATHAGISTRRVKTTAFLLMGLLAGIAGLTMSSMFSSATPTVGQQFFFTAIIAVYLGSIFLKDGVPNLWGTVVASLFLAIVSNGFNMIGLMYWHEQTAQGVLMIVAISMITFVSRKNMNIKM
jgi:ribose/xylose/arabinose/galactoside ABC-type transport system permease subunit